MLGDFGQTGAARDVQQGPAAFHGLLCARGDRELDPVRVGRADPLVDLPFFGDRLEQHLLAVDALGSSKEEIAAWLEAEMK